MFPAVVGSGFHLWVLDGLFERCYWCNQSGIVFAFLCDRMHEVCCYAALDPQDCKALRRRLDKAVLRFAKGQTRSLVERLGKLRKGKHFPCFPSLGCCVRTTPVPLLNHLLYLTPRKEPFGEAQDQK